MAWPMGVSGEALVTKTRRNVQEESHHIAGFLWCCPVWPGPMLGNTMTGSLEAGNGRTLQNYRPGGRASR